MPYSVAFAVLYRLAPTPVSPGFQPAKLHSQHEPANRLTGMGDRQASMVFQGHNP